ncbi:MAG: SDR family NAD(P)-dependent oxidoreductase [Myxococcota bacterium]
MTSSRAVAEVVLVTGAGSGIGRATAKAFADLGASLIVCDIDPAGLAATEAELGPKCLFAKVVDVASRDAMAAFAAEVHARVSAVDVLVNNAGVALHGGVLDTSLDDWDWLLGINLKGVIHGCHFFAPSMLARRKGHIVNVSSTYGFVASSAVLAYATSKFAVFGLSEALRAEVSSQGVGVTTICPGMINTNIVKRARWSGATAGDHAHAVRLFEQRGAAPEKVAQAIVDGVRKKKDVVPVAPEAWVLYGLKRLAPRLTAGLIRRFEDRLLPSLGKR